MESLKVENPECKGVIAATTGNHGQSIAVASANAGLTSVIVVPKKNSSGKNPGDKKTLGSTSVRDFPLNTGKPRTRDNYYR